MLVALVAMTGLPARAAEPAGPSLQVVLRNELGGSYVPVRAEASLDGKPLFEHVAGPGRAVPFGELYRGTTSRGVHALALYIVYEGRSPLFGYVALYRFHMRARATMEMKPGRDLEVTLTAFERGPLTNWENRPDFRVTGTPKEALLDVETLPIEKGQIKEGAAAAAKAPPATPKGPAHRPEPEALDEEKLAQIENEAVQEVLKEAERRRVEKGAVAQAPPGKPPGEKAPPEAVPFEPPPDFTKPTKPGRPPRLPPPAKPPPSEATEPPAPVASQGECSFPSIRFGLAQFSLGPKAKRGLRAWAACAGRAAERIRVVGHCDVRGSASYNQTLGQWRADAVARYLTRQGIPASRIEASSQGEDVPVCSEDTQRCHAQNRRVELGD